MINLFNDMPSPFFHEYDEMQYISMDLKDSSTKNSYIFLNSRISEFIDEITKFKEPKRVIDRIKIKDLVKFVSREYIYRIGRKRHRKYNFYKLNHILYDVLTAEKLEKICFLISEIRKAYTIFFRDYLKKEIDSFLSNIYGYFSQGRILFVDDIANGLHTKIISRKFIEQVDKNEIIENIKSQLFKFDIISSPVSVLDIQNFPFDDVYFQIFKKSNETFHVTKEEQEIEYQNITNFLIMKIIEFRNQFFIWNNKLIEQIPKEIERIFENYSKFNCLKEKEILRVKLIKSIHDILEEVYIEFKNQKNWQKLPKEYNHRKFDKIINLWIKENKK